MYFSNIPTNLPTIDEYQTVFLAVKTPLGNNIPPPMGQDTYDYVYVPWHIQRDRDFRTSDFAMVRAQSRLTSVGTITEFTNLLIVLAL